MGKKLTDLKEFSVRNVDKGTVSTSAISPGFTRSGMGCGIIPTKGVMTNPLTTVYTSLSAPRISTCAGGMPSSSSVSRSAAARASGSETSTDPPGSEICPL